MDWKKLLMKENEKPLESLVTDGGFCGIFRTMGFVGDSLSSGEFESNNFGKTNYHDFYEYSWGQYIARNIGCKGYNFSRGGMTAEEYCEGFAAFNGYWSQIYACQAYVIALGVNDVTKYGKELGELSDIDINDWKNNKKTFAGYYGQIIQRLKEIQPDAKFFLMTVPNDGKPDRNEAYGRHSELLHQMAELFSNTYVLDFRKYAPVYDDEFHETFFLGHMTPAGYLLTARMVESYIDYIIRHNMKDFNQVGLMGTGLRYDK